MHAGASLLPVVSLLLSSQRNNVSSSFSYRPTSIPLFLFSGRFIEMVINHFPLTDVYEGQMRVVASSDGQPSKRTNGNIQAFTTKPQSGHIEHSSAEAPPSQPWQKRSKHRSPALSCSVGLLCRGPHTAPGSKQARTSRELSGASN